MSILYGVGVGPGDPELLTIKALNIIRSCEVIAVPTENANQSVAYNIVLSVFPDIVQKEILCLNMPMTKDLNALQVIHNTNADVIAEKLNKGFNVAFLTIGDPTIYSTYFYIADILNKKGYNTQIINGISSFLSAASIINQKLTLNSDMLHVIPATYNIGDSLQLPGTKVFLKAGTKLREFKQILNSTDIKVFMIENIGMPNEFFIEGINNFPDQSGYYTIVIVYD